MKTLLYIGIGGFVGSVVRYLLAKSIQTGVLSSFPYGTLTVNILGCLVIGLIYGVLERGILISPELRLFLTVGICGGFTTFSTFSSESFFLIRDGQIVHFIIYTVISVLFCLIAVFTGYLFSKLF